METSLAPSPIARVTQVPFLLARPTTSLFCFGETLQQITEFAFHPNWKNAVANSSSSSTIAKVKPSITMHILGLVQGVTKWCVSFFTNSSRDFEDKIINPISASTIRFHDFPISMAVSCLSPVSTQSFMLADIKSAIVSGTWSWRRSSIAEHPRYSKSYSSSS